MQRNTNPPPTYARPPTPKAAPKAKDNCLNIGRDDIAPAMFMHVPQAPKRSKDRYGYQCYFGGGHHAVQNYIEGGWVKASVFRDTEKDLGEVQINLHLMEGGSQDTRLMLNADDMQRLACALLDAAHHLRTVPAAPWVWHAKSDDAQAVQA